MSVLNRILGKVAGCEVEWLGGKSFMVLEKHRRGDFWFSHRAQLISMIDRCKVDLVVDVGANEGQFAEKVRSFYSGEMISFEPVSSIYKKLSAKAARDPNWRTFQMALGSRRSTETINVAQMGVLSSMLKSSSVAAERWGADDVATLPETIQVERFDDVIDAKGRRIFLKLDTQGYDLQVFAGLGAKLAQIVLLQSEVSLIPLYEGMPHWIESLTVYENAGFQVIGMFPVVRNSARVLEYDCLMARAD
jgi:FkbM family methyltransferase